MGDPMDAATALGPIAQPNHPAELETVVADAARHGARVVVGGKAVSVNGRGRFFGATLLADVGPACAVMQRENFGPILPVARVDSDADALARMNASSLGLAAICRA